MRFGRRRGRSNRTVEDRDNVGRSRGVVGNVLAFL
jgi:hypothetical protein